MGAVKNTREWGAEMEYIYIYIYIYIPSCKYYIYKSGAEHANVAQHMRRLDLPRSRRDATTLEINTRSID